LKVEGFGRKCLSEVAELLEVFFTTLRPDERGDFAQPIAIWRSHVSRPERIPEILAVKGEGDTNFDPGSFASAQISIRDLPVSRRAQNVLGGLGLKKLHDLAAMDPSRLRFRYNCGRRTINELEALLRHYFEILPPEGLAFYQRSSPNWIGRLMPLERSLAKDNGEERTNSPVRLHSDIQSHESTLAEVLSFSLDRLTPRNREILGKRVGLLSGQRGETLEAIGRKFNITRERVRQIAAHSLKQCVKVLKTARPDVYPSMMHVLRNSRIVSLDDLLTNANNAGHSQEYDLRACFRMLLLSAEGDKLLLSAGDAVHRVDDSGQLWSTSKEITAEFYKKVLRTAHAVLRGVPMDFRHTCVEIAKQLQQFDDEQIALIRQILRGASRVFKLESSAGGELLHPLNQNVQQKRREFAYGYIKEQAVPVHILELFSAMQDFEPELIPDSPTRRSAIHTVSSLLERDDRFAWAGLSTWGLREWGYPAGVSSVRGAAIELLRASSQPLSTAEIARRLCQLYRVSRAAVDAALKKEAGLSLRRDPEGRWYGY
jgi:hypothetical protein